MFPSVASLEPTRPGALAEPEVNDPPCILHCQYELIPMTCCGYGMFDAMDMCGETGAHHTKTGRLVVGWILRGV